MSIDLSVGWGYSGNIPGLYAGWSIGAEYNEHALHKTFGYTNLTLSHFPVAQDSILV
jgi:hypothetical protein